MSKNQIVSTIINAREQHKTDEDIVASLLAQGYKVSEITTALNELRNSENVPRPSHEHDTQKKTINIIVTIGAILIGASLFSFIASNWQELSRVVKVLIILAGMAVSYGVGAILHIKYQLHKTAHALIFLGTIIYGAGIFLVGQMFNLPAEWPDGFVLWMTGIIILLLVYPSRLLLLGAAIVGFIGTVAHPVLILEVMSGQNPVLLTSEIILLLGCVSAFYCGYRLHKQARKEFKNLY